MLVHTIFQTQVNSIHNLTLYHPASHRTFWDTLAEPLKNELISQGEYILSKEYAALPMSLFMKFHRTGNRTAYEDALFSRRIQLVHLVLAECVEYQGRFLDDIIDGIFLLCEETAWQLPAHNSYIRDTPQLLLPDKTNPVLDLFACETGSILGTLYYLLKEKLDEVSPVICHTIEAELSSRIITPYLTKHFWWMGRGEEPMNNWTIWCTQNVLLTGFYTPQSEDTKKKLLSKACQSIDFFLKEYGEDGCCDEGAQYYRHAGLCLFHTLQIINDITDNAFDSLWQDKKIKNIATYISKVYIGGPYYLNFADCSPKAGLPGTREFLFGKYTNQPELMDFAASAIQWNETWISEGSKGEHNLFYRVQEVDTLGEVKGYEVGSGACGSVVVEESGCSGCGLSGSGGLSSLGQDSGLQGSDVWTKTIAYESVGIYGVSDSYFTLAVKAGDNDDSHNHNDTGSMIIYANNKPFLIDVGVESYTQKTFSDRRYEIWTMQSAYHNLPTFHGVMQHNGADYKATDVQYHCSSDDFSISMELKDAYGEEAELVSYRRSVEYHIHDRIKLCDKVEFIGAPKPWTLSLMTYEKPVCSGSVIQIGSLGSIEFEQCISPEVEVIPIEDARLKTAWDHEIYRILISTTGDELRYSIVGGLQKSKF